MNNKYVYEGASIRNNRPFGKPNEDVYAFDEENGFAVLLDGVSRDRENGVYPVPSPALEVSQMFSDFCMSKERECGEASEKADCIGPDVLARFFRDGNEMLRDYNAALSHYFPAGTVGILISVREGMAHYAYIGDCNGLIIRNGEKRLFTEKQTLQVAMHKKELTTSQIRYEICNHASHPYGYGVLDGNPGAMDFVRTGSIAIMPGDVILLYSDGAERVLDSLPASECAGMPFEKMKRGMEEETKKEQTCDDQTIVRISILR